ncbi:MAG: DUF1294 domain-containing protein [Bacteroidota bacterium]
MNLFYPFAIWLTLNLRTLWMMFWDKRVAVNNGEGKKKQRSRTPENTLLLNSLLFGFGGIGAGMLLFRHKIRKTKFLILVPLTAIVNIAAYYYLKQALETTGMEFTWSIPG